MGQIGYWDTGRPMRTELYEKTRSRSNELYPFVAADPTSTHRDDRVSCLSQNFTVMTFVLEHIINSLCVWLAMPNHSAL